MRIFIVILCVLSLSGCASWNTNKTLWAASSALIALDWGQTRYISTHPDKFYEQNSFIGRHPTLARVDTYFASYMLINTAMMFILPDSWQPYWFGGMTMYQGYNTINNTSKGIGTDFGLRN